MLISDEWRALNARLHRECEDFGSKTCPPRIRVLRGIMHKTRSRTILDYGCGKGTLGGLLGSMVRNYDPAVPDHARDPEPAEIVVCWDVLEHVESECLDDVLDHLRFLARKALYLVIATRPDSKKCMADGRNPHLIVEPAEWWLPHIRKRWPSISGEFTEGELDIRWTS